MDIVAMPVAGICVVDDREMCLNLKMSGRKTRKMRWNKLFYAPSLKPLTGELQAVGATMA